MLQESMPSALFTRWKAYAEKEPFGYPMDNYRMSVPAATLMNTINSTVNWKRKPRAWKPADLCPDKSKRAPDLTQEQREHIRKKHGKRRNSNG